MSKNLGYEILKFDQYVELFKYEHIVLGITDLILKGKVNVGEKLPSITELLDSTGYSRVTIDKGYKRLISDGIVKSVKYKGYFVLTTKISSELKEKLESVS